LRWQGIKLTQGVQDLGLPASVEKQISKVVSSLGECALALWLSGSAARGMLRRSSDIDWVLILKPDFSPPLEGWPTLRHSFHAYNAGQFVRELERGREFAIWQLAYGRTLILDPEFGRLLRKTVIPGCEAAVRSKEALLGRRRELISIRLRLGDFGTVRKELLELVHQEGRLRLLSAGIIPGCRAEVGRQLQEAVPSIAAEWQSFATKQKQLLATSNSSRSVLQGARAAGIFCSL
jgi:hypothetical protein